MKQIDKVFLDCDVAFEVHARGSNYPSDTFYKGNKDFKKTGKHARRVIVANSLGDFHSTVKGINPRYSRQRKDWTQHNEVEKHLTAIMRNVGFEKIEESTFESASYGEVIATEL